MKFEDLEKAHDAKCRLQYLESALRELRVSERTHLVLSTVTGTGHPPNSFKRSEKTFKLGVDIGEIEKLLTTRIEAERTVLSTLGVDSRTETPTVEF